MDGRRPDFLPDRSLVDDERAIEGLPIRLVIAVVVGIAALSIMMGLLNGLPPLQDEEVAVDYDSRVINDDGTVTMTVIDQDGGPVSDATVILDDGNARLDQPYHGTTGADGNVTFEFGTGSDEVTVDWRSNQDRGSVAVDVDPPTDSNYQDNSDNGELTVIRT